MKQSKITYSSKSMGGGGYWYVRRKPGATPELLHRLVMEAVLDRHLGLEEIVHHINGDKLDNRIENLRVMSRAEHVRLHRSKGQIVLRPIGAAQETIECACGCGLQRERWSKNNLERRFINGHNQRGKHWKVRK